MVPASVPALAVRSPGARTLVQDTGLRNGRSQGVPAGGVLDRSALRLVNALLDNPPGTEALEVALSPPVLVAVDGPVRVAISGSLRGTVHRPDGTRRVIEGWTATTLAAGDTLHLQPPDGAGDDPSADALSQEEMAQTRRSEPPARNHPGG